MGSFGGARRTPNPPASFLALLKDVVWLCSGGIDLGKRGAYFSYCF